MALFGLFGKKDDAVPEQPKRTGEFFLDFEEAQTLGNTEYMKQSKVIKRTFPKVRGAKGATLVTQVSADKMRNIDPNRMGRPSVSEAASTTSSTSSFTPTVPAPKPARPNRSAGNDLDMFRKMAKDIKR